MNLPARWGDRAVPPNIRVARSEDVFTRDRLRRDERHGGVSVAVDGGSWPCGVRWAGLSGGLLGRWTRRPVSDDRAMDDQHADTAQVIEAGRSTRLGSEAGHDCRAEARLRRRWFEFIRDVVFTLIPAATTAHRGGALCRLAEGSAVATGARSRCLTHPTRFAV